MKKKLLNVFQTTWARGFEQSNYKMCEWSFKHVISAVHFPSPKMHIKTKCKQGYTFTHALCYIAICYIFYTTYILTDKETTPQRSSLLGLAALNNGCCCLINARIGDAMLSLHWICLVPLRFICA